MALARIRTQFPEEVTELREALIQAGYTVETIRPNEFRISPADLELTVEKLPVVEAWRRLPEVETVFVAPRTPESSEIRSSVVVPMSHEPLLARLVIETGEAYGELSQWMARQSREMRARLHDLRQKLIEARRRWTPPREYHAAFHLKPRAPSVAATPTAKPDTPKGARIDAAIEQARKQQEELRRQQEAEQRELQERARASEENRRRAREAAEAKALLEEQQKIGAMVRVTERVRERVVTANIPAPAPVERRRPYVLPRTRRDRASLRAGVAALAVSAGLGMLAAQVLHRHPASAAIPKANAASVPFAKPKIAAAEAQSAATSSPPLASTPAVAPPASSKSGKPPAGRRAGSQPLVTQNEVIVRRPSVARVQRAKPKPTIVHYSDLD